MFSIKHPLARLLLVLFVFSAFLLLYVLSAQAEPRAVILNLDKQTHKVFVEESGMRREFLLEPGQEITGVCSSDCWLQLEGDEESYTILPTDLITIEEGQVFLQEEAEPAAPRAQEEFPNPQLEPSISREDGHGDDRQANFN